jgi:hypothetical protein
LIDRAQRIRAVCERHGVPLRAAAVQFPLGHPAVQTVVVGCRSLEQIQDSVRMFETDIPAALMEELKAEDSSEETPPVVRDAHTTTCVDPPAHLSVDGQGRCNGRRFGPDDRPAEGASTAGGRRRCRA